MPDKMNMFTWAEASSDATSKERTLPIMPTSTSYYNPLPMLKINQDEDWMKNIRPVLPCIKKSPRPLQGNSKSTGLKTCMTISGLDSKTQHCPVQQVKRRRRQSKICAEENYDWLVASDGRCTASTTKPLDSTPLPYNGLVLAGRSICKTTRAKSDFNNISSERMSGKEHHVTLTDLPKQHHNTSQRHPSDVTNAFSITRLTYTKEKNRELKTKPSQSSNDHSAPSLTNLQDTYLPQLPKIGKSRHLKAVPLLGGQRIIYNKRSTAECSDVVPSLTQLAPVVKGLNKKSRKHNTSPSLFHSDTKKVGPFLPKLSQERVSLVSKGLREQREDSICPPFTAGLLQPRPPKQAPPTNISPRRYHSKGVGPGGSTRAGCRHE